MASTPLTRALSAAGVEYLHVSDAAVDADAIAVDQYVMTTREDRRVFTLTPAALGLDHRKYEAALKDKSLRISPATPDGAFPDDVGDTPGATLAGWIERRWPTLIDTALANSTRHLRFASGAQGMSIVLPAASLVAATGAIKTALALPKVLQREEPYFAVYADGIRSLEPDKEYLFIPSIEAYFPEVVGLVCSGESDEFREAFLGAIAAVKRLLPKPDADEVSRAHYAFLKER